MESISDLKNIIDSAPEGASHYDGIYYRYSGDEVQSAPSKRFGWEFVSDGSVELELTRSLSDIKRIIELMELNQNMHTTVAGYIYGKDWVHWNEFNAGKFKL